MLKPESVNEPALHAALVCRHCHRLQLVEVDWLGATGAPMAQSDAVLQHLLTCSSQGGTA